eukprot:15297149-Alexandrium_andersonii.AAC.1
MPTHTQAATPKPKPKQTAQAPTHSGMASHSAGPVAKHDARHIIEDGIPSTTTASSTSTAP